MNQMHIDLLAVIWDHLQGRVNRKNELVKNVMNTVLFM